MTKELYRLTKEEAGSLTHDEASAMVGPWWFGNEGKERLDSKVGRQELHRVYLRNTFNNDSSPIPDEVLESHALEPIGPMAHCWFSRELAYRREEASE